MQTSATTITGRSSLGRVLRMAPAPAAARNPASAVAVAGARLVTAAEDRLDRLAPEGLEGRRPRCRARVEVVRLEVLEDRAVVGAPAAREAHRLLPPSCRQPAVGGWVPEPAKLGFVADVRGVAERRDDAFGPVR